MDADPVSASGRDRLTRIDLSVYGIETVLKSVYRFTGSCFVHLQHDGDRVVALRMRPKRPEEDPDLAIRNLLNDLVDQQLRSIVAVETAATRDLIMAHALSQTTLIRPDLETADPKKDPQNVSIPDRTPATAP